MRRKSHKGRFVAVGLVAALGSLPFLGASPSGASASHSAQITISLETNGTVSGKNNFTAVWENNYIIPKFEAMMKKEGKNVKVNFIGNGADDADYTNKIALEIKSGAGPDVFDLDGPYVGAFAEAGYIKPLASLVGQHVVNSWSGWNKMSPSVRSTAEFGGVRYGIPTGPDGRVLFYNKTLFKQAGLSTSWQPKSWADIINAAKVLQAKDHGIEALQIDAGVPMGEATTLQGFLPFLAGAGQLIWSSKTHKWQGDTAAMRAAAGFYHTIYSSGLANSELQLGPNGRNNTFQAFSEGKVGIYLESEYLYIGVLAPGTLYPMSNEAKDVGYALIPSESAHKGIRNQDFISLSGGGTTMINPHTAYPQIAWKLLTFLYSKSSVLKLETTGKPEILARRDVNAVALAHTPVLSFIAKNCLPIGAVRPSLAIYPEVSILIQDLAQNLATGKSVNSALHGYVQSLDALVGAKNVTNS